MKKVFNKKNLERILPYLMLVLVTLFVGFPLFKSQVLNGHDAMFHLFRMNSLKVALEDGQLIGMINPYMMGGFGYAANMFYGVLTSYIALFIQLFTGVWGLSINLLIIFSIFFSGLFMYKFMMDVTSDKIVSFVSAVIYMTFPYRLFDIYMRMSLGEIMAFVFVPVLFQGIYNVLNKDGNKWYLITLGTAGLLLTHNVSTFMVAIFAGLYLVINYKKVLNKEVIKKLIKSLIFAVLLSLITIVPLMEAKFSSDYMVFHSKYMAATPRDMKNAAINIFDGNHYLVNTVRVSLGLLILIFVGYFIFKKNKEKENSELKSSFLLALVSVVLTLKIVPWRLAPSIFSIFQFPWRFLQMTSFFLAILIPLFIGSFSKFKKIVTVVVIFVICIAVNVPLLNMGIKNEGIDDLMLNSTKIKNRVGVARSTGMASSEYLPRNAIFNYEYLAKRGNEPIIISGKGEINKIVQDGTKLKFDFKASDTIEIELPYIYYPGYLVYQDGDKLKTYETSNGMLGVTTTKSEGHIKMRYAGTNLTKGAYLISIISFIVLLGVIIREKKMTK